MTNALDIIIIVLLAFAIVMFATGNGESLMRVFSGGREFTTYQEYDRVKFDRACLIFFAVLLLNELAILFLGKTMPRIGLVSLIVTVLSFAGFIWYLKKYAKK